MIQRDTIIRKIRQAAIDKQVIRLHVRKKDGTCHWRIVEPFSFKTLKDEQQRWHSVTVFDRVKNGFRTFLLDNVINVDYKYEGDEPVYYDGIRVVDDTEYKLDVEEFQFYTVIDENSLTQ